MKAICLAVSGLVLLSFPGIPAYSQTPDRVASTESEKKVEGQTIVIELPPTGKQVSLPIDPTRHTTLVFDGPIKRVIGNPQGAVTQPVKGRTNRLDIWPQGIIPEFPKELVEPLGGNFSVELKDRTLSVSVVEATDREQSVRLATVRSTPGKVETLQQEVQEAQDEATSAREDATKARREANAAKQEARAATARARAAAARAEARVKEAQAETASARSDAAKARENAAKAEAKAAKANAEAAEAKADAEEARAVAAEATARAEAAEARRNQAIDEMLLVAARELVDEGSYRLLPEGGFWEVSHDRLGAEFRYGTWQDGYFLLESILKVPRGRPFQLGEVRARLENGKRIPLRIVMPQHAEASRGNLITTVFPGQDERMILAFEVPADQDTDGIELELYQANSDAPPVVFQIARYPDGVIMAPETKKQRQQRLWAKQVVIGPRVSLGGCWLASGLDGDDDLTPARCIVAGAYISKGVSDLIAIGVDAVGSWSEDAQFNRDPNDLTRSVKLFRATAFGDARFSRGKIVPYLRLGIGLQVTDYQGPPDSATEIALTYAVGGGAIYRLGENMSAGLTGQFTSSDDRKFRSLEAGVHLSYGWNP